MLAVVLQLEDSHELDGIWCCIPVYGFHFVPFYKLEVPKMWENSPVFFSPVLQFSAFCIIIPTFEVKSQ